MSRYGNTSTGKSKPTLKRINSINKYNTTVYDKIPLRNDDIYLISTEGDRLDNLAHQFYKDSSLWWYIAKANNLKTMNIPAGISIRVPSTIENARGG